MFISIKRIVYSFYSMHVLLYTIVSIGVTATVGIIMGLIPEIAVKSLGIRSKESEQTTKNVLSKGA